MSETSPVTIPGFKRKKNPDITGNQIPLESLPIPALLVETDTWKIQQANSPAAKLIGISKEELIKLQLFSLFANWNSDLIELITSADLEDQDWRDYSIYVELASQVTKYRHNSFSMKATRISDRQVLIILEPGSDYLPESERSIPKTFEGFWEITKAAKASDIKSALTATLEAAARLSESNLLAVYLAQEGEPVFTRYVEIGEANLFPEKLTDLDLDGLKHTDLWVAKNRPSTFLHSLARKHGLNYLASQMLGELNATIGILLIADQKHSPVKYLPETIRVIGSGMTALVQIYAQRSELFKSLSEEGLGKTIYEQIHRSINEGVITIDPDYRILELNFSAETILGYKSSEARGQSVNSILIGEQDYSSLFENATDSGLPSEPAEIYLYRRNGDKFLTCTRVVPIFVGEGLHAIAILIQDLTEQEEIRNRAQQYEQRATLGEVTAMFTHEMRNMINNISTTLQLMNRQVIENESHRKYIVQMLEECDRLSTQVTAVLEIAKPKKYEMVALDVPQLLNRLLDRYKSRILRARVQCEAILAPECPNIEGNQYALEEVFGNLISNALEAMGDEGGRLVLRVNPVITPEGKTFVQVAVADTAPGIPPEFREHIFQPFYTTKKKGTGLGLAITKAMVSAHRGNIRVEFYTPGTIFYVQLPAYRERETRP